MISLVLVSFWTALAAQAGPDLAFTLESGTVSYKIVHKFHEVQGTSRAVKASARLLADGALEVHASVPVKTFDSGNDSRDAHMLEAVEAAKYPLVELEAKVPKFTLPPKFPATTRMTLPARVRLHGVEREAKVEATIRFTDPRRVKVTARLTLSLESHGIERPSLMFVKIDDPAVVAADLSFTRAR